MLRVNTLSGFGRIVPAAGGGYDADAEAFFTAAGITDTTQKNAVDALVVSLKAASIWTKMIALYPFVGGDATKHSYNLKDPGAYQITWNGTVTHNSNGIQSNGSTGYGNTGLNALSVLTEDNAHLSVYSRTNSSGAVFDIGAFSGNDQILINPRNGSNLTEARIIFTTISVSNTDSQGFYIKTRRSQTDAELYKNGSSIGTTATNQAGLNLPNLNVYICCVNNAGSPTNYSTRNLALASLGASLTDTEAADFHTAVETFQDALSRGIA